MAALPVADHRRERKFTNLQDAHGLDVTPLNAPLSVPGAVRAGIPPGEYHEQGGDKVNFVVVVHAPALAALGAGLLPRVRAHLCAALPHMKLLVVGFRSNNVFNVLWGGAAAVPVHQ